MLPRLLALLCLSSLLAACSSTPPAPALATTAKPKPALVAPESLPSHLRELSGQLLGVPAAGEAEFQYHGGNRLGANSLLSCIYGGMEAGIRAADWVKSHSDEAPESVYTDVKSVRMRSTTAS